MKTLVIGASEDTSRFSNIATRMLKEYGHEVVLLGQEEGNIAGTNIQTGTPPVAQIDTITLYLSPKRQPPLYQYMVGLKPRRVIFNPGTENAELEQLLANNGIGFEEACTLVLLRTGQY